MSFCLEKVVGAVLPIFFKPKKEDMIWYQTNEISDTLRVTSSQFEHEHDLPWICGGEGVKGGENTSPQLSVANIPAEARNIMFIMEDRDPPLPKPILHTAAYNIDPIKRSTFEQGYFNSESNMDEAAVFGLAFRGKTGYQGPRPVIDHGVHRYYFEFYAFPDLPEPLVAKLPKEELISLIKKHAIARGHIVGNYERTSKKY